jgi:flagella basal body P-ring formation protein FlgA
MLLRYLCLTLILFCATGLRAAETDIVIDTAERFARLQTQGLPGKVQLTVGKLDVSRLPPYGARGFLPPGTRLSGRTHVGVRCLGPNVWSVLVPVQIAISGNYVATARRSPPDRPWQLPI